LYYWNETWGRECDELTARARKTHGGIEVKGPEDKKDKQYIEFADNSKEWDQATDRELLAALMLNYRTGEVLALLSLPLPDFSQPQTEEADAPAVGLAAPGLSGWGFLSPFVTGARAEESAAFINQATGALFPADDLLGKLLRQAGLWPESAASLPDALSALPHRLGFDEPWQFEELPAVVSSAGGADASCLITPLHACLLAAEPILNQSLMG
jgi:hypothetical protein